MGGSEANTRGGASSRGESAAAKPWYRDPFCLACAIIATPIAAATIFLVYLMVFTTIARAV